MTPFRRLPSSEPQPGQLRDGDQVSHRSGQRFMLWIDAVGGYLFCLDERIVLGQSAPGTLADIPIQADISRRHAQILRLADGYVLEPLSGHVLLNGRVLRETSLLANVSEIQLGASVKLRFAKSHVLSSSARLEIISGHRTVPRAEGVILMAESCVLGPKRHNHIVCPEWSSDVVLYRSDDSLMCRSLQPIEINGRRYEGRAPLVPGDHAVSGESSFCIEAA